MWFKLNDQMVELTIFVKPNAKRTKIVSIDEDNIHIALHAKPHEGEANQELINYLAKLLHLPKSSIILQRGQRSRYKKIIIPLNETVNRLLSDPMKFFSE